ncbi:MAG: hypothetical protein U0518_05050 [Candidatus Gracilibacteria bacterium]
MTSSINQYLPHIGKKPAKISLQERVKNAFYRRFLDGGRERFTTEHLPNATTLRFAEYAEFKLYTSLMSHSYFRIKLIMADTVIVIDERLHDTSWARWHQILHRSDNFCHAAVQALDDMLEQYTAVIKYNPLLPVFFAINGESVSLQKMQKIRDHLEWHGTYMRFKGLYPNGALGLFFVCKCMCILLFLRKSCTISHKILIT